MRLPRSPALLLALWLAGVGCLRAEAPGSPLIVTRSDTTIQPDDATSLTRLTARPGKGVWLRQLATAQMVRPPARSCQIYLQPEVRSGRLRRGELRRGTGFAEPQGKTRWVMDERPHDYARVSLPERPFESEQTVPGLQDGPFAVTGKISDEDLVQAVDLVRTDNPSKETPEPVTRHVKTNADGSIEETFGPIHSRPSIDHVLPVSNVEAKDADHLEISTSSGHGSGQLIKLQREGRHWKIAEVWQWVA